MTKTFLFLAADLLERYSEELSNHGCNDYELENTPKNQELMVMLDPKNELDTNFNRKKIITYDWFLAQACAKILMEQAEIKKP